MLRYFFLLSIAFISLSTQNYCFAKENFSVFDVHIGDDAVNACEKIETAMPGHLKNTSKFFIGKNTEKEFYLGESYTITGHDFIQSVKVSFSALDNEVMAIHRTHQFSNNDKPTKTNIENTLIQKYGAPNFKQEHLKHGNKEYTIFCWTVGGGTKFKNDAEAIDYYSSYEMGVLNDPNWYFTISVNDKHQESFLAVILTHDVKYIELISLMNIKIVDLSRVSNSVSFIQKFSAEEAKNQRQIEIEKANSNKVTF